jgi:rhodanese-related sulfurtransferase
LTVQRWVDDAKTRIQGLSIEELKAELEAGDALVLDLRDVRERWRDGTIPGARSTPRGMLEFWADPESEYHKDFMDPKRRTIVYCAGGQRSALAADMLQKLGYENVAHLEPGFNAWKAAGAPSEPVERR